MAEERILCSAATGVVAKDERGRGHGNHHYEVYRANDGKLLETVRFQKGPIQEAGINGVQNEDLLMIVIDRLIGFQTGDFPCEENEDALRLLIRGRTILQLRTAKREARGVEGTNAK